jgi:voltage-gated potassium channel
VSEQGDPDSLEPIVTVRLRRSLSGRGSCANVDAVADPEVERLVSRAKSPDDAAALARWNSKIALPLVLAAVLPLIFVPSDPRYWFAAVVNIAAWIVFVVDLVVHERRLKHYLRTRLGRFDLVVVILTAPWFLIFGPNTSQFVVLIRLARVARLVMAGRGARGLIERLGKVALVAAGILFLGAAVAYRAEHPQNPEFATFGDSLWWAIVTLTTVGYGDIVPETTTGRVAGVFIMLTGVAVLGVLAGSLASFFGINKPADDAAREGDARNLGDEVAALRAQVSVLTAQISQLVSPRGDNDPSA